MSYVTVGKPPDLIFQQALCKEHVSVALAEALQTPTLLGGEKSGLLMLHLRSWEERFRIQSNGHRLWPCSVPGKVLCAGTQQRVPALVTSESSRRDRPGHAVFIPLGLRVNTQCWEGEKRRTWLMQSWGER